MYLSTKGETKMIKANDLLKTEHTRQIKWLDNQIKKDETSIFLNAKLANKAFEKLTNESLIPDEEKVEKYVKRYLSDTGTKRLVTTLRVALSRAKNDYRLQINLTMKNNSKLEYLKSKTNLTKQEIINKLLEEATLRVFESKEEQLEITL